MSGIRERIQDAMKDALRAKDSERLSTLRMMKGALLVKEKDGSGAVSEDDAIAILRSEVKKREQTIELLREHDKASEIAETEREIGYIEAFLPAQLTQEQVEERVRAYLAEHPDITHAGRLTGALKKELGDSVDGKMLNEVCQKALAE